MVFPITATSGNCLRRISMALMMVTFLCMGTKAGVRCGAPARRGKAAERGFTLVELLIVVAILGILTSVALPNVLHARKRAEMTGLLAEARLFQQALLRYHADMGTFPSEDEFNVRTLEPLVSRGYLRSAALLGFCKDGLIHQYKFDAAGGSLPGWHVHPRFKPFDKGQQNMWVQGDGACIIIKYMDKQFDTVSILPLIR